MYLDKASRNPQGKVIRDHTNPVFGCYRQLYEFLRNNEFHLPLPKDEIQDNKLLLKLIGDAEK